MPQPFLRVVPAWFVLLVPAAASAVEVQVEGEYRARLRAYDTLSIDRDLAQAEGLALQGQHRLWLRPSLHVSHLAAGYVEIRGLDNARWGTQALPRPHAGPDPQTPRDLTDRAVAPAWPQDGSSALLDLTLTRAWGEFSTEVGDFRFGRVPVHWGLGIWQNDGLGWNAEYGDSEDRVEWEHVFENVFAQLAVGIPVSRLVNEPETLTQSYTAAAGYRAERIVGGLQAQVRRNPALDLGVVTVSAAAEAEFGPIDAGAEVVGRFGSGRFDEGPTEQQITAGGAALAAAYHAEPWRVGLQGGAATGDGDPADGTLRTFTFSPDYNISLILFQRPMPILAEPTPTEEGMGRDLDATLSGFAASNAIFGRPAIAYELLDDLEVEGGALVARVARVPEQFEGRTFYGTEGQASLRWSGVEGVDVAGTFAAFFPGSWYRDFSDDTFTGFSGTVYAGQVITQIQF